MPDDPESVPAPRSRRRRRATSEAASEATTTPRVDPPQADEPGPTPPPIDHPPLPTFLRSGRGPETVAGVDEHLVSGQSREAADRILDGWVAGSPVEREAPAPSPAAVEARPRPADHGWLPVLDDRSPDPEICPFLRAVDDRDRLIAPVEAPDPANRCAALRDAVPQSLRQQELVCLASGHVSCPRYLRGAVVIAEAPPVPVRPGRAVSPAVIGSVLALIMAVSASLAFVLARGGLELTAAAPTPSPIGSQGGVAQASATPAPTTAPTPLPTTSPSPTPTPSPSPSPTPTPRPTAKPTAKPTTRPAPTSDRYAVLRPCPDAPRCWIYRVRAGDNIYSIANWFGISQDSIYDRNPFVRNGLRPGQDLRLPPPTR